MIYSNTIIVFILIVPLVVMILMAINAAFAPHSPDAEKVSAYDCGMIAIGHSRSPFPVAYYVVAILFMVFDLEIVLLFPLALCLSGLQLIGFWVGIVFLVVLTLGFVYEIGSGALYFTDHRSKIDMS